MGANMFIAMGMNLSKLEWRMWSETKHRQEEIVTSLYL